MSLTQQWNISWLHHNSQRKYPLANDASCVDITESFEIPADFLVSLYLPISAAINSKLANFYIQSIASYRSGYTISVGYWAVTGPQLVAKAAIPLSGHTPYTPYVLRGLGNFYDSVGSVTIDSLETIAAQPPGQWEFNLTGGRLELDTIRPSVRGVSSLKIRQGSQLSPEIFNDIVLSSGDNTRITHRVDDQQRTVIRFDALDAENFSEDCDDCDSDQTQKGPCLRSINQVTADAAGRFFLVPDIGVTLEPITNGLKIKSANAHPCCGSAELKVLSDAIERLDREAVTLQNNVNLLDTRTLQLSQIIGLRTGDRGCNNV